MSSREHVSSRFTFLLISTPVFAQGMARCLPCQFRGDDPFNNLLILNNTGTRFASLSGSKLEQLREDRVEVKLSYSFRPSLQRPKHPNPQQEEL